MEELTKEIKDLMRSNAIELVKKLIENNKAFRMVLWTRDDWDKPLPENILINFAEQIVIDIKEMTLDDSYIKDGNVIIDTVFGEDHYNKTLSSDEIIAITSLEGQPYLINSFEPDIVKPDLVRETNIKDAISNIKVNSVLAERSMNAFIKNNNIKGK